MTSDSDKIELAHAALERGDIPQVMAICNGLALSPNPPKGVFHLMGVAMARAGNHRLAQVAMRKEIALQPENEFIRETYFREFELRYDTDAKSFSDNRSTREFSKLGDAISCYERGEFVEALAIVAPLLNGSYEVPGLYYFSARCLIGMGKHEDAMSFAKAELQFHPNLGACKKLVTTLEAQLKS